MKRLFFLLLCLVSPIFSEPKESIDDLKQILLDVQQELWGWCSAEKSIALMDLVFEVKPAVYVEIGVFGGASLLPAALAIDYLNEGVIVAIDAWDSIECIRNYDLDKDKAHVNFWTKMNLEQVYFYFLHLLTRFEIGERVLVIKDTSDKAALLLGEIDILHIDGNHSNTQSLADAKNYFPKVRSGGYIWLSDASKETVFETKKFLLERCDFVKALDQENCLLLKKR